jgi:hypothetical protein
MFVCCMALDPTAMHYAKLSAAQGLRKLRNRCLSPIRRLVRLVLYHDRRRWSASCPVNRGQQEND